MRTPYSDERIKDESRNSLLRLNAPSVTLFRTIIM